MEIYLEKVDSDQQETALFTDSSPSSHRPFELHGIVIAQFSHYVKLASQLGEKSQRKKHDCTFSGQQNPRASRDYATPHGFKLGLVSNANIKITY